MKTKYSASRIRPKLFLLVTAFAGLIQYQNCAQPVNQAAQSTDPNFIANPLTGGSSNGVVTSTNGQSQMFFAASSLELSPSSQVLRAGGICSLARSTERVQWQLVEDAANSMVLSQGSESCEHGSFYVNLSSQILNLECEKAYSLVASHLGEGSAQLSIIKHCAGVASN